METGRKCSPPQDLILKRRPLSKATTTKDSPYTAVGYIRLSTQSQMLGDRGLDRQAERIRKLCARRGIMLHAIYEDVWSGVDSLGAVRRDGLLDAVTRARETGSILVVTDPTRLFRNVAVAREFLDTLNLPVLSVREGRIMKAPALLRAIERGEESIQNIRHGTEQSLTQKKAEGVVFSTSSVRSRAAQASAKSRAQKADKIVHQIAITLRSDPAYRTLTHEALADLLNRQRILSGWDRPWTRHSVRDARKKAEALTAEWEESDSWDDDLPVANVDDQPDDTAASEPQPQPDPVDDEEAELRKLPFYGQF